METAIKISDMVREYTMGETKITAVDHISFEIPKGAYTIILGTSGAGKSTVLNILGGKMCIRDRRGHGRRGNRGQFH